MNGFKMSDECRYLRAPKTHMIRLEEGEEVSQRTHSILRRVTLSISTSMSLYKNPSSSLYRNRGPVMNG